MPTAPLGDLVTISGGGTPRRDNDAYFRGDIPWVTPKDMKSWEIHEAQINITEEAVANSAAKIVSENCILIVVRSGVLKHSLPVALARRKVAINQDLKALKCGDRILPEFLARFLKHSQPEILGWVRATTADNFPIETLRELSVPLPPLDEQRRIAAILDQADDLRRKRREALGRISDLARAKAHALLGHPLTNPKEWRSDLTLGEVSEIVSGVTKGRKLNGAAVRSVPYLAVANVQDGAITLKNIKYIDATEEEIRRLRLRSDDLLLTEGGDPDKLGRGSLWSDAFLEECIHQNHVFRVRVKSDQILPAFLNWLIGSERGKRYFLNAAKQTTGIASINMTQLRAFPLLVPPLAVQNRFVEQTAEIDKLKAHHRAHLARLDALFASLQHRAFRGDLPAPKGETSPRDSFSRLREKVAPRSGVG